MTIKLNAPSNRRSRPIRDHAYTLPVVRELPAQPADAIGAHSLW
jgi:hypothetical protein